MRTLLAAACLIALTAGAGLAGTVPETEPNDTMAQAQGLGVIVDNVRVVAGLVPGDVDWFLWTADDEDAVYAMRTSVIRYGTGMDTVMALWDSNAVQLVYNDDYIGYRSGIATSLGIGRYYNSVSGYNDSEFTGNHDKEGPYDFSIFKHFLLDEAESNDTRDTAQDLGVMGPNGLLVGASIGTGTDVDWYSFTLAATTQSLALWTVSDLDLKMTLYDAAGNEILFDDDGGPSLNPGMEFARMGAGTYNVMIEPFSSSQVGDYRLFGEGFIVPEPGTTSLVGLLGLAAAGWLGRRFRR